MKDFFKYTLATITGIIIFALVVGIFCVISLIGMAASDTATTQVKDNSVFVLKLSGTVDERASGDMGMLSLLAGGELETMGLDDILGSIEKAKANDDIKGIYIEAGAVQFDSYATVQTIRDALKDFKKSGKWIVAYGDEYLQMSYWLSTVADEVYLNKTGMIDLKGLGRKAEYYTGLYEKLGIKYQAVRVGKYKSYVESNTRKDMSPEDREQRMAYMQGAWNHMLKDIAESRKLTPEGINQMVNDSIMMFADPDYYVTAKLVDKLLYPDEFKALMKKKLQLDEKDDVAQLTLTDMTAVRSEKKEKGDKIAVYYAVGEINDESLSSFTGSEGIVGNKTVNDLRQLADDEDIKAVVLRVNSPGGSAVASEQIWHAVKQLKEKKPVVVSMGGVAASGGYMISAAANYIFAEPTTITGSIGIFGLVPNFSGLVTDKLGVTFDDVTTNTYTNYMENITLSKENSRELGFMQSFVDRGYDTFLTIVADGRKMKKEQVNEIAQGRVWLATDALGIKLVDKLGSLDDAVKKAAELAKLEEYYTASYPAKASFLDQLLEQEKKGSYLDAELRNVLGDAYDEWVFLRTINKRNRLQARLPFSTRVK
ncbi:MAG: signal peptide peptidase SppA [Prevotella sp.]|nr:signal peptide peptidase SppA [Prevotella sp.]